MEQVEIPGLPVAVARIDDIVRAHVPEARGVEAPAP